MAVSEQLFADLDQLEARFRVALEQAANAAELEAVRVKYLARKGEITESFKILAQADPADRPRLGQRLNQLRDASAAAFAAKQAALSKPQADGPSIDLTLPGIQRRLGSRHPVLQALDEIKSIFVGMGFTVESGPLAETDYYNFEALNLPPDHPSRDLHDTFYLSDPRPGNGATYLLRTHTSPVQIHALEQKPLPIRIIAPGRCFRKDTPDATHSPVFHQVEGLWVDEGVTFADLKGVLSAFARKFFGASVKTRFRPSYFPFTEPSAELDVWFEARQAWIELLGCGMVNPIVLERLGIDTEKYTGFAFGMGVERPAMRKYGVTDLRLFYDNDVRLLRQF
ncbi:MAG: phenylalanine--tRNA ligase subunit alpha [candidate division KSB1 bacterium]|nr:phenylalanine--tRNA ligase subunit alpha [candidate division KSB1 bacterium]MDZ7276478.1 phenylalanine--tRNA ligase subunit alpha [candidate division KSB1 bacterium]MDZ7286741.1 phenylalanine--tRNA ligase subunit alpha [candidate division KSB1 bacterium]MDZ7300248.1 phenylalanine--tRNA ligase subunit alpha [candidate division KSB1 bacterium]MDZ7306754.1 phenylalanine--tRNA ligase subunit alpha [candidate division KSB1 bacterium]